MPALSSAVLYNKLQAALPAGTVINSQPNETRPALVNVPGVGVVRIYLWTVTRDLSTPGARPPDEFKIQLILPEQARGSRGSLDLSSPLTLLLGYSPDFGVFVAWEARLHETFGYSKNVQIRESLLDEARSWGWGVAEPRSLRTGDVESRAAFSPGNLGHYLKAARDAGRQGLTGNGMVAFYLFRTPNGRIETPPATGDLIEFTQNQRERMMASRLSRDSRFGPRIKEQYGFACALCRSQLEVVEGAHIIPVHEPESRDELWNGITFCANHHKLFDARSFIVRPDLHVRIDGDAVAFFRECHLDGGLQELLLAFEGQTIRAPNFFTHDAASRERMERALERRAALSGLL